MPTPLASFRVELGWRFWVAVYFWQRITDSPHGDGTEACYLIRTRHLHRKVGELHFSSEYCDEGSVAHEIAHVIAELRRRLHDPDCEHGEEWCAKQADRLMVRIRARVG